MPQLGDVRHEAFARARARGARVEEAYEDAGFAPGNDHGYRLNKQEDVAQRIAELRAEQTEIAQASTHAVIAALLRVVKAAEGATTPAAMREIRATLLEAERLRGRIDYDRRMEKAAYPRTYKL